MPKRNRRKPADVKTPKLSENEWIVEFTLDGHEGRFYVLERGARPLESAILVMKQSMIDFAGGSSIWRIRNQWTNEVIPGEVLGM